MTRPSNILFLVAFIVASFVGTTLEARLNINPDEFFCSIKTLSDSPIIQSDKQGGNPTCAYAFNSVDEFTKQSKIGLKAQHFFSFTDPELRKFMKEKEFLDCSGYLSDIAGMLTLNIQLIMDSPYSKEEYGPIQAGSNLIIRLINGETVTLLCEKYAPGTVDTRKKKTIYNTVYRINPKDEKLLSKIEIDKVRIVWGVGYEDYEVYELDFLIDQFSCLQAARDAR